MSSSLYHQVTRKPQNQLATVRERNDSWWCWMFGAGFSFRVKNTHTAHEWTTLPTVPFTFTCGQKKLRWCDARACATGHKTNNNSNIHFSCIWQQTCDWSSKKQQNEHTHNTLCTNHTHTTIPGIFPSQRKKERRNVCLYVFSANHITGSSSTFRNIYRQLYSTWTAHSKRIYSYVDIV